MFRILSSQILLYAEFTVVTKKVYIPKEIRVQQGGPCQTTYLTPRSATRTHANIHSGNYSDDT